MGLKRPGLRKVFSILLLLPVMATSFSLAAPADPFSGASRSLDSAAPTPTDLNTGDWGVAEQLGAATYTIPIVVPPGRNGMSASLALRYSSQSSLRGGVAAGWTLNIPTIEVDYSFGAGERTNYKASLGSASGRLVEVSDESPFPNATAYRLQFDESQTRFFLIRAGEVRRWSWVALTSDGVKHYFEDPSNGFTGYFPWHIVRQVDAFGNTVLYNWELVASPFDRNQVIDVNLASIEYTSNPNAGLAAHAKVGFEYAPVEWCSGSKMPIGATERLGQSGVQGSQRLAFIKTYVKDVSGTGWRPSQTTQLTYHSANSILTKSEGLVGDIFDGESPETNEEEGESVTSEDAVGTIEQPVAALPDSQSFACSQNPLRYLDQVDVTAFSPSGEPTSLPPITLKYNERFDTRPRIPAGFLDLEPLKKTVVNVDTFGEFGDIRGLRGSLRDVDGDGIRDQIKVVESNEKCRFTWRRGLLGGGFDEQVHSSPLPTFPWLYQTTRSSNNFVSAEIQPFEACTLSGQVVQREVSGGVDDGRPSWAYHSFTYGYNFLDYTGDGRLDLIIAPFEDAADTSRLDSYPVNFPPPFQTRTEEDDAPGKFFWLLYRNAVEEPNSHTGSINDPVFSVQAWEVASPVPLPTLSNQEVVLNRRYDNVELFPPLFDINGDGFLDAIRRGELFGTLDCEFVGVENGHWHWCVYLGHGGRTFDRAQVWYLPEGRISGGVSQTTLDEDTNIYRQTTWIEVGLYDVTGDGLSDFVAMQETGEVFAYRNTGSEFDTRAINLNLPRGFIEVLQTDYCCAAVAEAGVEIGTAGFRGFRRRLVDLDQDGLLDFLFLEDDSGTDANTIARSHRVMAAFNTGGYFLEPVELPDAWLWAKRLFSAENSDWHLLTDFADVTGDGLADLAQWDGTSLTYISSPGLSTAPDLLRSVQNGRGLRIDFSYAPSSNPAVVTRTSAVPGQYVMPNVSWVVTETRVNGGFTTPVMVTRYTYADPERRDSSSYSDKPEPSPFAGFRRVERTVYGDDNLPARRVTTEFSYSDDPQGREVRQWTYEAQNATFRLDSYRETKWTREKLFAGQAYLVHPTLSLVRTCLPDTSDTDCRAQTQNVYRSQELWTGLAPSTLDDAPVACGSSNCGSSPYEIFVLTERTEGEGVQPGVGDRSVRFSYDIRYGQGELPDDDYRVRVRETVRELKTAEGTVSFGHSLVRFDEITGLPEWTRVWRSDDGNDYVQTDTVYDSATGNLLRTRKPMQREADAWTKYTYDDCALFIASVENELSQKVYTTYDLATGVLLKRLGPNFKLGAGEGASPQFEAEVWQIDGFGRVVEHGVTLDDEQLLYKLYPIEHTTYDDLRFQQGGEPVTIRRGVRLNFDDGPWSTSEITLDGMGRVLKETQSVSDGAAATTTYGYDALGNLSAVNVPDPSSVDLTNSSAPVQYTYAYDGLGRLTDFLRPDGNGVQIVHSGLQKTVRELTADGSGGSKQESYDVFGRLMRLREMYPGSVAETLYSYDANDNLEQVTDADGNITSLLHDWTDNRVQISRGERTWRYDYDLNGNMSRGISPTPPGESPENYTANYIYDDLDRVVEMLYPVRRGDSDLATETKYLYDEGVNGLGRLSQVDLPFGTVRYAYDARGSVVEETRAVNLTGAVPLTFTQQVNRSYNALGQTTRSVWDDGQQWQIGYDSRGLVESVEWYEAQVDAWKKVAGYARNLMGLPVSRDSSYGQSRSYKYDVLGRPIGDTTFVNTEPIASRDYTYSDSGDLLSVDGRTGAVSAAANYSYDAQHRLLYATGPNGYEGAFTYSPAGNVLTAKIDWLDSPQSRSVRYEYGAVDPQAVDRLVNVENGDIYASFSYDPVGNMTKRITTDGEMLLYWDGLNQLREVKGPRGGETYYYDQNGSRVLAVSEEDGVRFWFGERETHFNVSGAQTERYLHLSGGGPTLARVESGSSGDRLELQYADELQNLMFSLDEDGNRVAGFLYGAFGEVVYAEGEDEHRRQFNGKENDAVSGLSYYGYRYYDPLTLRWSSADPLYLFIPDLGLNDSQRMNLYSFSVNNPVRYFDPDGREADEGKSEDESLPEGCEIVVDDEVNCVPVDENEELDHEETNDLGEVLTDLESDYQEKETINKELRKESNKIVHVVNVASAVFKSELLKQRQARHELEAIEKKLIASYTDLGKTAFEQVVPIAEGCSTLNAAVCGTQLVRSSVEIGVEVYQNRILSGQVESLNNEIRQHDYQARKALGVIVDGFVALYEIGQRGKNLDR